MKNLGCILLMILFIGSCFSQVNSDNGSESAQISFDQTTYDYGTIKVNSDGTCEFKFKNKGNTPLVLTNVRSTCGCTVPQWPKQPIKKGKTGIIKVKYNTRIKGTFNKSIYVYSNGSPKPVILKITGTVVK
jgi:hypothetical protein